LKGAEMRRKYSPKGPEPGKRAGWAEKKGEKKRNPNVGTRGHNLLASLRDPPRGDGRGGDMFKKRKTSRKESVTTPKKEREQGISGTLLKF